MNKVLFISVHPDDETLGCGGTILKHKAQGDEIYWLIFTNISEKEGWAKEQVKTRQKEIQQVADTYGFKGFIKLNFPTTKLDIIPMNDLITSVSKVIKEIEPNTIYLPNRSDVHTDHQIAFKTIISCTKNFRYPFIKRILMYESLSETEFAPALPETIFIPSVYVDITDFMGKKLKIIKVYKSEMMASPLPRGLEVVEALGRFRGSRIGVKYAEAFQLLIEII